MSGWVVLSFFVVFAYAIFAGIYSVECTQSVAGRCHFEPDKKSKCCKRDVYEKPDDERDCVIFEQQNCLVNQSKCVYWVERDSGVPMPTDSEWDCWSDRKSWASSWNRCKVLWAVTIPMVSIALIFALVDGDVCCLWDRGEKRRDKIWIWALVVLSVVALVSLVGLLVVVDQLNRGTAVELHNTVFDIWDNPDYDKERSCRILLNYSTTDVELYGVARLVFGAPMPNEFPTSGWLDPFGSVTPSDPHELAIIFGSVFAVSVVGLLLSILILTEKLPCLSSL